VNCVGRPFRRCFAFCFIFINRRSARKRDLRSWDTVQSARCRRVGPYQCQIEHKSKSIIPHTYFIKNNNLIIIIIIIPFNAMQCFYDRTVSLVGFAVVFRIIIIIIIILQLLRANYIELCRASVSCLFSQFCVIIIKIIIIIIIIIIMTSLWILAMLPPKLINVSYLLKTRDSTGTESNPRVKCMKVH